MLIIQMVKYWSTSRTRWDWGGPRSASIEIEVKTECFFEIDDSASIEIEVETEWFLKPLT